MKELQSLIQYAEILEIQVEDLSHAVNSIMAEKSRSVNSSVPAQLRFLLSETHDAVMIRSILKMVVEND